MVVCYSRCECFVSETRTVEMVQREAPAGGSFGEGDKKQCWDHGKQNWLLGYPSDVRQRYS